jgi:prophage regulatory protein
MYILRLPEVKRILGHRADASVYNAIRAGLFTTGVAIGQRAKGWPNYEAQAIAAARVAGKSDDQIRELVQQLHAKRTELVTLAVVAA